MTQKELIFKIRELRQIKPREDWVSLTKSQILGEESRNQSVASIFQLFFRLKPGYIGLAFVFVLFGAFGFTQNSLPGDLLYPVKKIVERSQAIFVSEKGRPQASIELANKRLEELTKIAETNQVKKLAPALEEYQASIAQVTKNLSRLDATSSGPVASKKIVDGVKKLEVKIQEVKLLGVVIGEEEFDELQGVSDKLEVGYLISDLEKRTLTEEQSLLFEEAKKDYEAGEFTESLKKLLILSSPQE